MRFNIPFKEFPSFKGLLAGFVTLGKRNGQISIVLRALTDNTSVLVILVFQEIPSGHFTYHNFMRSSITWH